MSFVVYCIRNLATDACYVGSSTQFIKRRKEHVYMLSTGRHHNRHLQHSWTKHGGDSFVIEVLEVTEPVDTTLRHQEQAWMDLLRALGFPLYNTCPTTTHTTLGAKFGPRSQAVKDKIRRSTLGKKRSEETRLKLRLLQLGKAAHVTPHTPETKERLRQSKLGRVWVTDGIKTKCVDPEVAKDLVASSGYSYGRI